VECPACGGLLDLDAPAPNATGPALRARFDDRRAGALSPVGFHGGPAERVRASGVWRFRELVLPDADDHEIVSHPEGDTPLLHRGAVAGWAGVDALLLKHDGHNPTGSFKDRGMTAALTQARRAGARAVACASTGNTSAALAAYAALAGRPRARARPRPARRRRAGGDGKLAQTLAYGARTLLVRGDFDRCLALVREHAARLGVYLVNSVNPYRVAGPEDRRVRAPAAARLAGPRLDRAPAGNLGNTSAVGAALRDAAALGLVDRVPRVAAVQAAGAAPFARAFAGRFAERRACAPRPWRRPSRSAIRQLGRARCASSARPTAWSTAGDDEELSRQGAWTRAGVGCEPASAASVAGVRRLVRRGGDPPGRDGGGAAHRARAQGPGILL
jgi:threonine synthase